VLFKTFYLITVNCELSTVNYQRSLQQRDCTGITPVSLLITFRERRSSEPKRCKSNAFFWTWK